MITVAAVAVVAIATTVQAHANENHKKTIKTCYKGREVRDENAPGKVYDNRRFVVLRKENIE